MRITNFKLTLSEKKENTANSRPKISGSQSQEFPLGKFENDPSTTKHR